MSEVHDMKLEKTALLSSSDDLGSQVQARESQPINSGESKFFFFSVPYTLPSVPHNQKTQEDQNLLLMILV
jgi:hypothetical protein